MNNYKVTVFFSSFSTNDWFSSYEKAIEFMKTRKGFKSITLEVM